MTRPLTYSAFTACGETFRSPEEAAARFGKSVSQVRRRLKDGTQDRLDEPKGTPVRVGDVVLGTVGEAARYMNKSERTVHRYLRQGLGAVELEMRRG